VKQFPIPRNVKEVQSFLGLAGYYRRFIRNYGQIAKPLTSLLKEDVTFRWTDLCQQSFEQLKDLLTQAPILLYPDFSKTFNLTCDACDYAIGCVLSQGPIGKNLPIAFASRTLNKTEVNYNTTDKELTSIVWGIKTYIPYLFGQNFNLIIDHRALVWLFIITDPRSRLTRWRLKLEEYQYTIHFKPGMNNTNADALSRIHQVTTRIQNAKRSGTHPDISNQNISETQGDQGSLTKDSHTKNEYQKFLQAKSEQIASTPNLTEITGDIFETPSEMPLALCVSEDLKMNKGIALKFRREFGSFRELQKKNRNVTDILMSKAEQRKLLLIITKKLCYHKPTYETIFNSLQNLKEYCLKNCITKLACPRLSCSLDGRKWEVIRDMLRFIFHGSSVHILVYMRDELTEDEKKRIIQ